VGNYHVAWTSPITATLDGIYNCDASALEALSDFPTLLIIFCPVHMAKFLLMSVIFKCLDPALTIAAALNSKSPFVTPFGREAEADKAKQFFKIGAPHSSA